MRKYSISGISLGLYIMGFGICYILQQSTSLHITDTWLRLYPILAILLGLDFIISNMDHTAAFFAKPSPWMITLIILIIVVGTFSSWCSQTFLADIPKFGHFEGLDRDLFDLEQGSQFTINQDFQLPPEITSVKIQNRTGNIQVRNIENKPAGKSIIADAQIKTRLHHLKPRFQKQFKLVGEVQGDTYLIKLDAPESFHMFNRNHFDSNLIIGIPAGLALTIENSAGNIDVASIDGNLDIHNTAGNVDIQKVSKNLRVSAQFGNVTLENAEGDAEISTKAGEVKINKINGKSDINSISGDVTVKECRGPVHIELKSGNLDINLAKISDNCDLDLKSGNIQLGLPADARFTINAQCISGDIDSDFGVILKREFSRATASGNVNGGGPLIHVRNVSGNINLQKYRTGM